MSCMCETAGLTEAVGGREKGRTECVSESRCSALLGADLYFSIPAENSTTVLREKLDEILRQLAWEQQISLSYFFFLGKVKSSSSISHIYTSLWKPWSYLTGTAGTNGPESTTQQTTTIGGFTRVCNLHICRTSRLVRE